MPVSVLEKVRGDRISSEIEKLEGFKPDEIFRVVVVPDREIKKPPKRKVYSDEVKAIAKEAKRRSEEDKKAGVTREESFRRMEKVMQKIGDQIKQNENND